jgi:hypothetical protein
VEGWFKTWRSIIDHRFFDNPKLFKVWMWCLTCARHEPGHVLLGRESVLLKRGQFIFGRKKTAEKLKMPESTVWDFMRLLRVNESIDIASTSKYSIITIKNWDHYQGSSTGLSTTNGQQMDTNKNEKNDKKVYITTNKGLIPYNQRGGQEKFYRKGYEFDPYDGNRSFQPTEEEERTIIPQLKKEFQEKLASYMEKEGIKKEEDVDNFKFPAWTDFLRIGLREIRKSGRQDMT